MASLQDVLMMNGPGDVTTGDIMANAPQKSVWRMLMEAAQGAQGQMDRVPWYVQAPFQPMLAPLEGAINTVRTGASGAENIRQGTAEDDPWRTTRGVGEVGLAGLSVLPATGALSRALMGTVPKALMTGGLLTGLANMPEAQAAGLTPEQEKRKAELQRKIDTGTWGNRTARQEAIRELDGLRRIETEFAMRDNALRQQQEADRRAADEKVVGDARTERDRMLADSWKPFHEQFPRAQAVMPWLPFMTGAALQIPGAIAEARGARGTRNKLAELVGQTHAWSKPSQIQEAATLGRTMLDEFPKGWQQKAAQYGMPVGIGSLEGAAMVNAPDVYNALGPGVNPERAAWQEYIKRLPEGHPERTRAEALLGSMPQANPYREAALDYFTSPGRVATRTGIGALEGGVGAGAVKTLALAAHPTSTALAPLKAGVQNWERVVSGPAGDDAMRAADTVRMLRTADRNAVGRLPPEPPVGFPTGPSGTQGPARLPPPTGGINGTQGPQPPVLPRQTNSDRWSYEGSPQQQQVQQAIVDQVGKGKAIPTLDELKPHLARDGAKNPVPKHLQQRLDNLTEIVTDLKTIGTSDDQIANFILKLMQSGKHTLPAVAAGTMGLGSMQFGDEPQQ